MLWGPVNHVKHLTSIERLPFSIVYIGTLIGTLYYSVWVSLNRMEYNSHLFRLAQKLLLHDDLRALTAERPRLVSLPLDSTRSFYRCHRSLRYVVSYIPGGARGLKFFSKLFYAFVSRGVSTTLSV